MTKAISILFVLLLAIPAFGQEWQEARLNVTVIGGGVPAAGVDECDGYLVCENCEGTGTPSGWVDTTTAGTVNWDYTTTALRGSQSLAIDASGTGGAYTTKSFDAQSTLWVFFRFRTTNTDLDNEHPILRIVDSGDNELARLSFRGTNNLQPRAWHGTAFESGSNLSVDTTYFIWVKYVAGTGENGVLEVYIDTDHTIPAATFSLLNGTSTANASKIQLHRTAYVDNDPVFIYDQILVKSSEIGNVPE